MPYLKFIPAFLLTGFLSLFLLSEVSQAGQNEKFEKSEKMSTNENQLIKCVDHILLTPGPQKSKVLYDFFCGELGLPPAWPYKNYGAFSSGAVYFGNVSLEMIEYGQMTGDESKIAGIALEPAMKTPVLTAALEKQKIPFEAPKPFELNFGNAVHNLWTSTYLKDLLPGSQIFFCEYHMFVPAEQRVKLNEKFAACGGGKLKVKNIKEIVISVKNPESEITKWNAIAAPHKADSGNKIELGEGPALRFIKGPENKIKSLTVKVDSLEKIMPLLQELKLSGKETTAGVELNSEKTFGVSITLE